MNNYTKKLCTLAALSTGTALIGQADDSITELDAFITEETALEDSNSLLPTDRTVDSAFFDNMELMDIPRSITVLSPETMEQFQISDFDDLQKIGAGTERYNFYGIAGAPVLRGWQGGTYFNGMLRLYQRNEMPTSFGSLEAMEIVKGPAPAQYIPSHVGGYANMIPKSPFFDETRGSAEIEIGSNDFYNVQYDQGGPMLVGEKPAAYRLSVTAQQSNSYYDLIGNDFVSIYGSVKVKLSDKTNIFAGAEYFQFKSNENAGWNRPTQNLVDNSEYVIGEPLSLVRAGNGGYADRGLLGTSSDFDALVVPESVITAAVANGTISDTQLAALKNLGDAAVRAQIYDGLPEDIAQTTSGYLYTPEYFFADGEVFTTNINANEVLADDSDYADSEDFMFFFDINHEFNPNFTMVNKVFIETLSSDKLSSYQYAFRMDQTTFDDRLTFTNKFDLSENSTLTLNYGGEIRYTEVTQLQDFWAEPFSRRDVTLDNISNNSVFLSGAQVDPITGNNYWGGGFGAGGPGGHAAESELLQAGIFASGLLNLGEKFSVITSVRFDTMDYEASVPEGPTDIAQNTVSGDDSYFNWSINPTFRLTESLSVYAAVQEATTFAPLQGGAVIGESNFGDSSLTEAGIKASLIDGKLYSTLAFYEWEQQSFNDITGISDPYESEGIEFELTYAMSDSTTLVVAFSDRETIRTSPLGFRTMPFGLADPTGAGDDEIGIALAGGNLLNQFSSAVGGFTPEGGTPSENTELIFPGAPETTFKVFLSHYFSDKWSATINAIWNDEYYHNFDHTILIDSSLVLNATVGYSTDSFSALLSLENLTEEDYFYGSDPVFAANTAITKAPESMQAKLKFTFPF